MVAYRAYMLNASGRIASPARPLDCEDDKRAMAAASALVGSGSVELWCDSRWIATIDKAVTSRAMPHTSGPEVRPPIGSERDASFR